MAVQKITPFLWFDTQAEPAAQLYTSIFPNSKITHTQKLDAPGSPTGAVIVVEFELDGQKFVAFNGGPGPKHSEAISFVVDCESQEEVDRYWAKLSEGGAEIQCGWLRDRFGVSWQIVPRAFFQLVKNPDPAVRGRVMNAMMQMVKFDIAGLERAAAGG